MKYYIADLHLYCYSQAIKGGINYDKRPFETVLEMHDYIVQRWNAKVTNGDTIYILGDIAMYGRNLALIGLVA